jgi:hypothetical protein
MNINDKRQKAIEDLLNQEIMRIDKESEEKSSKERFKDFMKAVPWNINQPQDAYKLIIKHLLEIEQKHRNMIYSKNHVIKVGFEPKHLEIFKECTKSFTELREIIQNILKNNEDEKSD